MTPFLQSKYDGAVQQSSIEVVISDPTRLTYQLPDNSLLRNRQVVGVLISTNSRGSRVTPSGNTVPPASAMESCYLTLRSVDDNIVEDYPVTDLDPTLNAGDVRCIMLSDFNPTKSNLSFGAGAGLVAGMAVNIVFYYI